VTACSEIYPRQESLAAGEFARELGCRHVLLETRELANDQFASNGPARCYECKNQLFARLVELARSHELAYVVDGFNADDARDMRPGTRAALEHGIRSPLFEAGFTKADIRELSRQLGLRTWDKPAEPCLSTRVPFGRRITSAGLERIAVGEQMLRDLGFRILRLRDHGDIARIEVDAASLPKFAEPDLRERVVASLRQLGFIYVTLDLAGYRTGSMNEVLTRASSFEA
jgi:uncharacterized protein